MIENTQDVHGALGRVRRTLHEASPGRGHRSRYPRLRRVASGRLARKDSRTARVWLRDLDQRLVASVPWDELPLESRSDFALLRSRASRRCADLGRSRVCRRRPRSTSCARSRGVHFVLRALVRAVRRAQRVGRRAPDGDPDHLESALAQPRRHCPKSLNVAIEMAAQARRSWTTSCASCCASSPAKASASSTRAAARSRASCASTTRSRRTAPEGQRHVRDRRTLDELRSSSASTCSAGRARISNASAATTSLRTRTLLEDEARRVDPEAQMARPDRRGQARYPEVNWLRDVRHRDGARAAVRRGPEARAHAEGRSSRSSTRPCSSASRRRSRSTRRPRRSDAEAGQFYVTPVDLPPQQEQQAAQLARTAPMLPLLAIHEELSGPPPARGARRLGRRRRAWLLAASRSRGCSTQRSGARAASCSTPDCTRRMTWGEAVDYARERGDARARERRAGGTAAA